MPIAHVTLATRDVAESERFFAAAFGWRRLERPGNIHCKAAWLEIPPGQELHLLELEGFSVSRFEAEFGRHVALYHPRADFDGLKERLVRAGAALIPAGRETPFARFFCRDPVDGYVFEIIEEGAVREAR